MTTVQLPGSVNQQLPLPQPSGQDAYSIFLMLVGWAGNLIQQLGPFGGAINSILALLKSGTSGQVLVSSGSTGAAFQAAVNSIADAANGGLNFSAGTGAITANIKPSDLLTKATPTVADSIVIMDAAASNVAKTATLPAVFGAFASVAQVVTFGTGALATGTSTYTFGDTIPQNTNGDQYMSVTITPTNANSQLEITVVWNGNSNANDTLFVGLFQDSTANALAAVAQSNAQSPGGIQTISFTHIMTAGTTSATTFKVRAGANVAGTTSFNGSGGTRYFGGVAASRITVKEYLP